jgi:hypothetical protein
MGTASVRGRCYLLGAGEMMNLVKSAAHPNGRNLNRRVPPLSPEWRTLRRLAPPTPVADITAHDSPRKDQLTEGCCTGETKAKTLELIVRMYYPHLGPLIFSPQFAYIVELLYQGNFPQDSGSDGVTLCNTAITQGCCEESAMPFVDGQIVTPTAEQYANAAKYKFVGAYHSIADSITALSVLADPVPWPVMMGFSCHQGLMSDECAETGIMPMPGPRESPIGGHEVTAVGADLGVVPTLRPAKCPPAFLFDNSWNENWGIKGRFWVPQPILDAPDTDLKIMHAGKPW